MKKDLTHTLIHQEQIELWMKMECFLHHILMLHLIKQTTGKYQHKELIFLYDGVDHYYQLYEQVPENRNKNKGLNGQGIPAALIYDTAENTYTALQYKYIFHHDIIDVVDIDFINIYKNTTHVMNITVNDQQDFEIISTIIKAHKCEFDVRIQTQYNNVYVNTNLPIIFQEISHINNVFIKNQGAGIRDNFFKDFMNKDYSKFKYDQEFIQEFYKFEQSYGANDNICEGIPSSIGKFTNNKLK